MEAGKGREVSPYRPGFHRQQKAVLPVGLFEGNTMVDERDAVARDGRELSCREREEGERS
jgi:hypothetical protein